ncbi:MAG: ABC transporter ATP-binding protein [Thalassobaculales bacterium]
MTPALELVGIDKRFGPVHANRSVSLAVAPGSIHGIVGENGAGKSTLMNILFGYYQADQGEIRVDGQPVTITGPEAALALGIGMVHQHFMLVETFTVLENLLLGAEGGVLLAAGEPAMRLAAQRLAADYGLEVDLDARIEDLPVGVQQRVEILKALLRGVRILILDEPTAVLTPQEADRLFALLRTLKAEGRTVILITHKLREIMAVTDRVTVMRQGAVVAGRETAGTSAEELAALMVGRGVSQPVRRPRRPGPPVLEVAGLTLEGGHGRRLLDGLGFTVHAGEILGVAGVAGNGQSELLEVLAGMRAASAGSIRLKGEEVTVGGHAAAAARLRARGLGHVPEDRLRMGVVASFPACETALLGHHEAPGLRGRGPLQRLLFDWPGILRRTRAHMESYDVRPLDPAYRTIGFSGGNQQKLVLAREIEGDPDLLLVGQPTRGVDIGAIAFIHGQLLAMREAGKAILLVSVELDEILALSDRILVMFAGRIVGEVTPETTDERQIGLMMAGIAAGREAA